MPPKGKRKAPSSGEDQSGEYLPHPFYLAPGRTPEQRRTWGSSVRTDLKRTAAALDPNGGKCLITHQSVPVHGSHIVARATKPYEVSCCTISLLSLLTASQMDGLEYWWNEGSNKFDIDTRYNVIFRA